jgi:ankyrin repeat protein
VTGTSELFITALCDESDRMRALLADGADPNETDIEGYTPLHLACRGCAADCVRVLLDAGAQVDATTHDGMTPLMVWIFYANGRYDIPEILCEAGADVNKVDNKGESATDLARTYNDLDLEWLLSQYARDTSY